MQYLVCEKIIIDVRDVDIKIQKAEWSDSLNYRYETNKSLAYRHEYLDYYYGLPEDHEKRKKPFDGDGPEAQKWLDEKYHIIISPRAPESPSYFIYSGTEERCCAFLKVFGEMMNIEQHAVTITFIEEQLDWRFKKS